MSKLITGIFTSRVRAEQAVDELMRAGFATEDVSLLMSESTQGREFAIKKSTKAPEAAATGAAVGGVLGAGAAAGGLTGALVGLGIPEHEAKFYAKEIEKGGILVGVYSHNDKVEVARDVLNAAGADKVTKGSPA